MNSFHTTALLTTDAYEYDGRTLYVSDSIFDDYASMIDPLLSGVQSLDDQIKTQISIDSLKKSKPSNTDDKFERDEYIQELESRLEHVQIPIHKQYIVNSVEHFARFHPEITRCPIRGRQGTPISLHELSLLENTFGTALYCGVGVYSFQRLATFERGVTLKWFKHLAFLCSSDEITFGTDLPDLVNIVLTYNMASRVSPSVLYQLMGRAGRVGKSYHALVRVEDDRILEKILCITDDDVEGKRMNNDFYVKTSTRR